MWKTSAKRDRDGVRPIVPGDTASSDLVRRLTSTDPEEQMPPPTSGKKLSAAEIDVITTVGCRRRDLAAALGVYPARAMRPCRR